jgi:Trk K+ transport system NAD-binding subunit
MDFRRIEKRLRYHVNDLLIRNPLWQILVLVVVSSVIVSAGVVLVDGTVQHSFWWSFTRLLDQGTFVDDADECDSSTTVVVGVLVTIGGIFVLSLLIGIFSSKITEQIDSLKRGRSPVVEKEHFIVCGNGDRLFEVTRELVKAGEEGSSHGRIVLFSSDSREKLEEVLVQRLGKRRAKKIICRSGDPTDIDALDLPGFDRCEGFVVIGDQDSSVIKTLVAVNSIEGAGEANGVCELRDRAKGRIAGMAFPDVNWIPVREIVMRLLVQVGRQPGLSTVYSEILSFDGNEFYIEHCEDARGMTINEISRKVSGGIVSGVLSDGRIVLNPPGEFVIQENDSLLVLEENRGSCHLRKPRQLHTVPAEEEGSGEQQNHLRMLVLSGESRNFSFMLRLLDEYSDPGSEIVVAGSIPQLDGNDLLDKVKYEKCGKRYIEMQRTDPEAVKRLHPEEYHSIMVISGKSPEMSDEDADSECIITLLIIRDISTRLAEGWTTTVVSEIRNPKNRRLATAAGIDDFVISNEVCSMIMAQLVIQPQLKLVYEEIFDPSGCEIQLREASRYKAEDFSDLTAAGLARGEVVLGWLTGTGTNSRARLNPAYDELLPEDPGTRIVVIAER